MAFSESLTVRILGDSSGLQRELDSVLRRLDDLQDKLSESADSARQLANSFSRISQAINPLQQVGSLLSRLDQLLRSISQRPLTLNVSPAIQALQQLIQVAQQAAAQIQAIPAIPVGRPGGGGGPFPILPPAPIPNNPRQRFAGGGLVNGPSGIDRVSTQLTAGEFVISRDAVESLGLGFFERLNTVRRGSPLLESPQLQLVPPQRPLRSLQPREDVFASVANQRSMAVNPSFARQADPLPPSISNNFGGITIQVSNQIETESLLRSLQVQGLGTRIRQG